MLFTFHEDNIGFWLLHYTKVGQTIIHASPEDCLPPREDNRYWPALFSKQTNPQFSTLLPKCNHTWPFNGSKRSGSDIRLQKNSLMLLLGVETHLLRVPQFGLLVAPYFVTHHSNIMIPRTEWINHNVISSKINSYQNTFHLSTCLIIRPMLNYVWAISTPYPIVFCIISHSHIS